MGERARGDDDATPAGERGDRRRAGLMTTQPSRPGPVTIDLLGDRVQAFPMGQLAEYAQPVPDVQVPLLTLSNIKTRCSPSPASVDVSGSAIGATGTVPSKSEPTALLPSRSR